MEANRAVILALLVLVGGCDGESSEPEAVGGSSERVGAVSSPAVTGMRPGAQIRERSKLPPV
ncbi:MAG: hypothetical protein ABEN55_22070, partial [Bradymonadaceae bacterium]